MSSPAPAPAKDQRPGQRRFLFLQGHPSRFFADLAVELRSWGHHVSKVNFNLGDDLFWRGKAHRYRGRLSRLDTYLRDLIGREGITDLLAYGDRLPWHLAAAKVSQDLGKRFWITEFGYLRPDWITLERDGQGAYSRFPMREDTLQLWAEGQDLPDLVPKTTYSFSEEAFSEVTYHLAMVFGRLFYPLYRSDKTVSPIIDYLSWLPVLALTKRRARQAETIMDQLWREKTPYNLCALQLDADYQVRHSSSFASVAEFLHEVLTSFAAFAPKDRHLVVKVHPLDNGLGQWFARTAHLAREMGLSGRVHVIRGGDLGPILSRSQGVVVINSTVGMHALTKGVSVLALGKAIYQQSGLAHQGSPDDFWSAPETPDPDRVALVLRALMRIQVRGTFYGAEGRRLAVLGVAERLSASESFLDDAAAMAGE